MITVHLCLVFSDSRSERKSRSSESERMWCLIMSQWYGLDMETAAKCGCICYSGFVSCSLEPGSTHPSPHASSSFGWSNTACKASPFPFPSSSQQCLCLLWATCTCLGRWGSWGELWVLVGTWERRGGLCWTWRTFHANLQCSFCHEKKVPKEALCSSHGDQEKSLLPTPNYRLSKAQWSSLKALMLLWHLVVFRSYFWQYCTERVECFGLAFVARRVPST